MEHIQRTLWNAKGIFEIPFHYCSGVLHLFRNMLFFSKTQLETIPKINLYR